MAASTARALIEAGTAERLGAEVREGGVNFAVYAPAASRLEVCLFDAADRETRRIELAAQTDGIWHGFVPGLAAGQRYGYRAHGDYDAEQGLRFNAAKLLLDPYTRALAGSFRWSDAVYDYERGVDSGALVPSRADSAAFVPKAMVVGPPPKPATRHRVRMQDSLIYELNLRGFTMRHPALAETERGSFEALGSAAIIEHLKALGVSSVELLPIHAFIDEEFLVERGLRNFWGYNTLAFFAPAPRYLGPAGIDGLRAAVDALHAANIEVLLDVVYNHTAEGGRLGPSLSFRGLANSSYYRLAPGQPGEYVNDSGCGNTINTDDVMTRRLIVESLSYWVEAIGIDGFRFDLATILGRTAQGFERGHPLFAAIDAAPALGDVKLIAEPWDVGPGGYRLGGFPPRWAEWNDQFRDAARRFWRRDSGVAPALARRVHGSADIFEPGGRGPTASVNFIASHDGFTTADLVSYSKRHNEANGENNHDGNTHNFSCNDGVEGASADPLVRALRRRHRINLLATLLLSQGTPMLLAGDEFGHSQDGNNNAYAQDNPTGWLDWGLLDADRAFFDTIAELVRLRRAFPLLRQTSYRHGEAAAATGRTDIEWFNTDGAPIGEAEWTSIGALGVLLSRSDEPDKPDEPRGLYGSAGVEGVKAQSTRAVAILFNAKDVGLEFRLPRIDRAGSWTVQFSSALDRPRCDAGVIEIAGFSLACLSFA